MHLENGIIGGQWASRFSNKVKKDGFYIEDFHIVTERDLLHVCTLGHMWKTGQLVRIVSLLSLGGFWS